MRFQIRPIYEGLFFNLPSVLGFPLFFSLLLFITGSVRGKGQSVMGSAASWGAKGLFLVTQSFGGGCRM